jgi:hypothetical protein
MAADELMTAVQAATLKRLAQAAYELDAFKPNLTRTEADSASPSLPDFAAADNRTDRVIFLSTSLLSWGSLVRIQPGSPIITIT